MVFSFSLLKVDMEEFPSNSREQKPVPEPKEEKVTRKVVTGDVIRRRKPLGSRMREMFLGDDTKGVVQYVVQDVLVPALKDMIAEAGSQGLERAIFGESRGGGRSTVGRSSSFGGSNHTNYRQYSSPAQPRREEKATNSRYRASRTMNDFEEVILPSRVEAMKVLEELRKGIAQYEAVTVRALYELIGVEFHHVDEKFGWVDLSDAGFRRISSGYLLVLPRPEALES